MIPEADQQIAREAHALPAEEELHEVVGRHQHQHREGEQRQVGEEARPVRVLFHVADGIEVHEGRHRRDHHQHHGDQRIDADGPVDLQVARVHPGEQHFARVLVREADAVERDPGEHHRDEQEQRGDELGRARARGRRFGVMMIVMTAVRGTVCRRMRGVIVRVMIAIGRAAARMPLPRAGQRDQACDDAAEQRKEDDGLIHVLRTLGRHPRLASQGSRGWPARPGCGCWRHLSPSSD